MAASNATSEGSSSERRCEYVESGFCTRFENAPVVRTVSTRLAVNASSYYNAESYSPRIPSRDGRYKVTNPQGICLIINIAKYDGGTKHPERVGSERDVSRIEKLFTDLKFDVRIHQNLLGCEIHSCVSEARKQVQGHHGCFVCFIMAHGRQGYVYGVDGGAEHVNQLLAIFQANRCKKLRKKPKIFFIQACRGDAMEIDRLPEHRDGPTLPRLESEYCPNDSDFLICYPTPEGYSASRDPNYGTIFVQTLCDVIEQKHRSEHLEDMMTEVNLRVIQSPVRAHSCDYYSVPERHSRLSKRCYFDPAIAELDSN